MSDDGVIFIVLDSARFDAINTETTPKFLKRVNSDWVTYENAFSNAPWTLASHASIFTGKLPREHTATAHSKFLPEEHPTIAEYFKKKGYTTKLLTNNWFLGDVFGMARGFDDVQLEMSSKLLMDNTGLFMRERRERTGSTLSAISELYREGGPRSIVNLVYKTLQMYTDKVGPDDTGASKAIQYYLSQRTDQLEFVFFNLMEPHMPYQPPKPYDSKFFKSEEEVIGPDEVNQDPWKFLRGEEDTDFESLRALYDGEMAYTDTQLERLFSTLEDQNELQNKIVVVCGDHGDHFGEHDIQGHVASLHKELLHVPLFVRFPQGEYGSETVSQPVSLRQLYDSLQYWTGGSPPSGPSYRGVLPKPVDEEDDKAVSIGEYMGIQDFNLTEEMRQKHDYRRHSIMTGEGYAIVRNGEVDYIEGEVKGENLLKRAQGSLENIPDNISEGEEVDISGEVMDRLEQFGYVQ